MDRIKAGLATSPHELRAHLRKRWVVFGKEERYLPGLSPPVAMEFDGFDKGPGARHFIIVVEEGGRRASEDHRRR